MDKPRRRVRRLAIAALWPALICYCASVLALVSMGADESAGASADCIFIPGMAVYGERKPGLGLQARLERALELLLQAAWHHSRVVKKPEPAALVVAFADSGINLELYAWIADPEGGRGNLRSDIYREVWRLFKANGIEIPFPQREVRILSGPAAV